MGGTKHPANTAPLPSRAVSTLAAALALPAAAATIFLLLRTAVARRIVAAPSAQRWHDVPTPVVGGIGIFVGFSVGIWAAV
jgi:UDP-N-acetylmuramyl pentapeptide phosphotransferase/UDP-N-acetylglucosamine-1-phosphate transferase